MEQDQHRTRSRAQVTHARPVEFHPALFHASVSRRRRKRRNSPRLVRHHKIFPSRGQLFHDRRSLFKRTSPLFVSLWGASAPRFLTRRPVTGNALTYGAVILSAADSPPFVGSPSFHTVILSAAGGS